MHPATANSPVMPKIVDIRGVEGNADYPVIWKAKIDVVSHKNSSKLMFDLDPQVAVSMSSTTPSRNSTVTSPCVIANME